MKTWLRDIRDDWTGFYCVTFAGTVEYWRFRLFGIL